MLVITLTAPEVHPPQHAYLYNNGMRASLYALDENLNDQFLIGTWSSDRDQHLYSAEIDSDQWGWYLGWGFADAAREAERVDASLRSFEY